ncbi:MAG: hypothetical protein QF570_20830 [Myxococcota bacterium]|jgi:hypothetical protein|nr:hypothetical protein [Myxococcota bacterium]
MREPSETPDPTAPRASKDYTRQLGVVESLVAITRECPSGPVRGVAQNALDAIKGDAAVMREQVYYVLSALQGWRGERASQVHASLTAFYEQRAANDASKED